MALHETSHAAGPLSLVLRGSSIERKAMSGPTLQLANKNQDHPSKYAGSDTLLVDLIIALMIYLR